MSGHHTPTPWEVLEDGYTIMQTGTDWCICDCSWGQDEDEVAQRANAALIVRAVNSHQPMLDALREAALQIEYLHSKFAETGSGAAVLARIRAAIAAATGESAP